MASCPLCTRTKRDVGGEPDETTIDGHSRNRLENGVDSSRQGAS